MNEYHKIQTLYERDFETNFRKVILGKFSLPAFEYLADNEWSFSEKVDGCNLRAQVNTPERKITFGGKTDAASIPATLVAKLNERFLPQADAIFEKFPDSGCLYGEGYGAKIQKGGGNYKPDGQDFVLFDVSVAEWWLERPNVEDVARTFGLDIVPILGTGTLHDMTRYVSDGFKSRWGDFLAEGIVARPKVELKTRSGARIITKLKHKDF